MKILFPFLLFTGVVWTWGLASPEESNEAISYAGTVTFGVSPENATINYPQRHPFQHKLKNFQPPVDQKNPATESTPDKATEINENWLVEAGD